MVAKFSQSALSSSQQSQASAGHPRPISQLLLLLPELLLLLLLLLIIIISHHGRKVERSLACWLLQQHCFCTLSRHASTACTSGSC
jgi:hypothetical protein